MRRISVCLIVLSLVMLRSAVPEELEAERIVGAWKKRQQHVRSAQFSWRVQYHETKGIHNPGGNGTKLIPPTDMDMEWVENFAVDHHKMLYHYKRMIWHLDKGELQETTSTEVYNGNLAKSLTTRNAPNEVPVGIIHGDDHHTAINRMSLYPILFHYWPFDPKKGRFTESELKVKPTKGQIDGVECTLVEFQSFPGLVIWVSPLLDYSIVRLQFHQNKYSQIDIEYANEGKNGPILQGWSQVQLYPDKRIRSSKKYHVISHSLNTAIPASTFELEFPTGGSMADNRYPDRGFVTIEANRTYMWLWIAALAVIVVVFVSYRRFRR